MFTHLYLLTEATTNNEMWLQVQNDSLCEINICSKYNITFVFFDRHPKHTVLLKPHPSLILMASTKKKLEGRVICLITSYSKLLHMSGYQYFWEKSTQTHTKTPTHRYL